MRFILLLLPAMLFLSGCVSPVSQQPTTTLAADGKPLPKLYRISGNARNRIPYEVLDSVNTLRSAAGAPPVQLNPQLTAAAATHSRDMSNQNRPWHFGSDGSSPIDRVQRVGYSGGLIGESSANAAASITTPSSLRRLWWAPSGRSRRSSTSWTRRSP